MFVTTGIVAVVLGLKFLIGFIIGFATAKVIYRSRLTRARTLRASLAAGIVFVLVSGVAGWAGYARIRERTEVGFAPWEKNPTASRNAIAGNEVLLCVIASIGIAALANVRTKDRSL